MKRKISISEKLPVILLSVLTSFLMLFSTAAAQEQIVVPLTNAGQPGQLNLNMIRGSLHITGYDGDEVIIRFGNSQENSREDEVDRDGLRRISGSGPGFDVHENNNNVDIRNVSPMKELNFEIMVPRNFSLKLSMVHGSNFIEDVVGDFEINHVNGEVILENVGGSAVVNTVNGNIKASFRSVTEGRPMAFSNVNGNLDISLPENARLNAKMRSEWGDVYTDFDFDLQQGENISRSDTRSGGTRVSVNSWVIGEINGGGPEYLFKTLRGDIYIRKQ